MNDPFKPGLKEARMNVESSHADLLLPNNCFYKREATRRTPRGKFRVYILLVSTLHHDFVGERVGGLKRSSFVFSCHIEA